MDTIITNMDARTYSCTCCKFFPLVFENDGSIKDAQEYEVDNDGNKYCFKCINTLRYKDA